MQKYSFLSQYLFVYKEGQIPCNLLFEFFAYHHILIEWVTSCVKEIKDKGKLQLASKISLNLSMAFVKNQHFLWILLFAGSIIFVRKKRILIMAHLAIFAKKIKMDN